jgi:type II secretory pathway component PulM
VGRVVFGDAWERLAPRSRSVLLATGAVYRAIILFLLVGGGSDVVP